VSVKLAENILERTSLDFLLKINKRCNYPNSLTDKEKAIISDGLSSGAPPNVLFSNQFKEDLERLYELQRFINISIEPITGNKDKIFNVYSPSQDLNLFSSIK
jgi:hypothetical protein